MLICLLIASNSVESVIFRSLHFTHSRHTLSVKQIRLQIQFCRLHSNKSPSAFVITVKQINTVQTRTNFSSWIPFRYLAKILVILSDLLLQFSRYTNMQHICHTLCLSRLLLHASRFYRAKYVKSLKCSSILVNNAYALCTHSASRSPVFEKI